MSTPTLTVWNKANAGRAIPVKWRLTSGTLPVADPSSFLAVLSVSGQLRNSDQAPSMTPSRICAGLTPSSRYLGRRQVAHQLEDLEVVREHVPADVRQVQRRL